MSQPHWRIAHELDNAIIRVDDSGVYPPQVAARISGRKGRYRP